MWSPASSTQLVVTENAEQTQRALADTMSPQGVNIGINIGAAAGAGIQEHLHVHIVPRWKGDTNFMPVTAETHVLSEALDETASKLRDALAAQPS